MFRYDRDEIIAATNTLDIKRIGDVARDILQSARDSGVSYDEAVCILRDIVITVIEILRRLGIDDDLGIRELQAYVDPLQVLLLSADIDVAPLTSMLCRLMPSQSESSEKSIDRTAHRIRKLIDEHYSEELSLTMISDRLNMSPKYLSRVFKQVMGINLSDYLAYVRVEKIKELLLTDMSLSDIAESVGVYNRTTFTRMFRKLEGMSPAEYRNTHRGI